MKNKKTMIAIISVVALLLVLIGVTYAYWLVIKTQTNSNIISSACLDITLEKESDSINLGSQYPMSDAEGMKLIPYTFTVTNNCNTSIDYQVVLESIGDEANAIASSAIKVALDTKSELLSNKAAAQTTVSGAYASHKLGMGTLASSGSKGSSVTHSLRIWIDENAPISESNKTYQSKISVTIGQGISNPIKEETLAYDILTNNDEALEINHNEKSNKVITIDDKYIYSSESYQYGTEYILDKATGMYQLSGNIVEASLSECRNGYVSCGKYTLNSIDPNDSSKWLYEVIDFKSAADGDYVSAKTIKYISRFGVPSEVEEGGLYKTADDLGESYYFRGNVSNNYVQFGRTSAFVQYENYNNFELEGGYTSIEECQKDAPVIEYGFDCVTVSTGGESMYWRVVRINGDGTIRLAYDGTTKVQNGVPHSATIGDAIYNNDYMNANYGDSNAKKRLDEWYNGQLKMNYDGYIADGIFCNDKEVATEYYYIFDSSNFVLIPTTQEEATFVDKYYASTSRVDAPKLTCKSTEDKYAISSKIGNGMLKNPIGLLTLDELVFAGATSYNSNQNFYLNIGYDFWTMTPYDRIESDVIAITPSASAWYLTDGGKAQTMDFTGQFEDSNLGIRPVINLRADVEFTGDGSFENPYVIKTN